MKVIKYTNTVSKSAFEHYKKKIPIARERSKIN